MQGYFLINEDNLLCAYEMFAKDYRIEQNYGNIILSSLNKYVIWQRGWDITPVVRLFLSRLEREILLLASENHTAM